MYGTTTNGLASGNTVREAVVHGLAEVMERHVRSMDLLVNKTMLVDPTHAPIKVRLLVEKIERAGLSVALRYAENEFGLPFFASFVMEPDEHHPIAIAAGFGFHPIAEIAAVRAIAEAVQGRLSHIHGGRDDIIKRVNLAEALGRATELDFIRRARSLATSGERRIRFGDVPSVDVSSVDEAQACMFERLQRVGLNHVAYVQLTPGDYPIQVVKVVVPGAEHYEYELDRVGSRLMKHALRAQCE